MLKKSMLISGCLLLSSQLFSQDYSRLEKTSRSNRASSKYEANMIFSLSPAPSYGFSGKFRVTPDSTLSLEATKGSFAIEGLELNTRELSVRYSSFEGNSFYLNSGVGVRSFEYKGDLMTELELASSNTSSYTDLGVLGGLGNQWLLDSGISLGCEWVGFYYPLIKRGEGLSQSELDSKGLGLSLLRFNLGYSF